MWKSAGAADVAIQTDAPGEFEDLYGNPLRLSPHGGQIWLGDARAPSGRIEARIRLFGPGAPGGE